MQGKEDQVRWVGGHGGKHRFAGQCLTDAVTGGFQGTENKRLESTAVVGHQDF